MMPGRPTQPTVSLSAVGSERGQSVSVFVLVVLGALIMTTGLVVDGGQKVTASSRAESAAAGASRAAANAGATELLAGEDPAPAAVLAARAYLAGQPGVQGSVQVAAGVVTVRTSATEETLFLSVVGIGSVTGRGAATANLVATGQQR
ncbi:MAG: hypothetical protein JWP61_2085 [Friedmanniella sp.]|nr:hypothetical protein [Friedmanniella sp.]